MFRQSYIKKATNISLDSRADSNEKMADGARRDKSFFIAGKSLTEFGDNASNEQLVYFLSIGKDGGTKYKPR